MTEEPDRKRQRPRRKIQPLTRIHAGDLVTVRQPDNSPAWEDSDLKDMVRLWEVGDTMFDFIPVGTPAVVVSIERACGGAPPAPDSHWITLLIDGKVYEALSDEVELAG
jgi:hypothetical protein